MEHLNATHGPTIMVDQSIAICALQWKVCFSTMSNNLGLTTSKLTITMQKCGKYDMVFWTRVHPWLKTPLGNSQNGSWKTQDRSYKPKSFHLVEK
jgi:hypothetical protein